MTALDPGGHPVRVGAAYIQTPGLVGEANAVRPSKGSARKTAARAALESALGRQGFREDPAIVFTGRVAPVRKGRKGAGPVESQDGVRLEVPDPGPEFGQVLLQTDQHGVVNWIPSLDDRPRKGTGSQSTRTYVIPDLYPEARARKGVGAVVSKLLEVFVFPRLKPLVGQVAERYAAKWEQENRPYQLRRFRPDEYTQPAASGIDAQDAAALSARPALLFVHGTFARAHSAFDTVPRDVMDELDRRYGGRLFAFNHFTITEDPLLNAQRFVDLLPAQASVELDLICHSRGGLVGRALAEAQARLNLKGRKVTVRRVVFAGSPNAGCVLADAQAMSHWVDRYTNWAAWLPTPGIVDIFEGVLSVVKQLAVGVLEGMPGLQSMVPDGGYLQKFKDGSAGQTQYFALASNYEPPNPNLNSFAHNTLMDAIFQEENDLVVPTRSMWNENGSKSFPIQARHVFDPDAGVDHGGYFRHPIGKDRILSWLKEPVADA